MKKHLTFLIAALFSLSMTAETYTILFNSSTSDSSSPTSDLSSIILSATGNCVDKIITADKIYRAKEGYGIKGGTASIGAKLVLGLDDTYTIKTITVYAAAFANKDDTTSTKTYTRGLRIYNEYFAWEENHRTELRPYTLTLNASVDSIMIASNVDKNNRFYVQKIEFEAEDPHPTRGAIETQYPDLDFGGAKWESPDEPLEDVLNFEMAGRNLDDDISLSLKKGSTFTLTGTTLPASGGEVGLFYSILFPEEVTKAIPLEDVVIAKGRGLDGEECTRELAIKLTIVPPSSGGASTFDLDTTRMSIGSMPGNYYQFAQGTADSTLKNHIGYIICCGRRYRYGSGSKKTWDGFYYTDRDPETNEVLDMYSNNHRYFDPEKPTASVSGFDIEHMLPKSWWGGDVNPAYCDLFHLVPGDYSANRSKSNHAPGIPADSSFNNGSFVTGDGTEAYGLKRVFCPADEYKGDFARAYFYIAACYGDSLVWIEKGEPGVAMTNEGWEEFQPWLRDLLLEWHRMDPVSEKELKRAIEVNKIQGNRNPFIDYPDLVEYIWGNKKGTVVNFYQLNQSYGDQYNDTVTGVSAAESFSPAASKYLRDGHLFITVGDRTYSILGQ